MGIVPDDKNWTWVLERPCPDCRFDATTIDIARLGDLVRDNAAAWPELLAAPDATRRPTESRWSALEYGCHVRDVFRIFDERLRLMLETDDPDFANWDQDAAAVAQQYDLQDPAIVADELLAAGAACAARFDMVTPDDYDRTGNRSDGSRFTIDSFGRYFIHDPVHHLRDVAVGNAWLRGAPGL
jgi:hypothetical protein